MVEYASRLPYTLHVHYISIFRQEPVTYCRPEPTYCRPEPLCVVTDFPKRDNDLENKVPIIKDQKAVYNV